MDLSDWTSRLVAAELKTSVNFRFPFVTILGGALTCLLVVKDQKAELKKGAHTEEEIPKEELYIWKYNSEELYRGAKRYRSAVS